MQAILSMCTNATISALLLIPIFWLFCRKYFHDVKHILWYFVFAVYLSGVYAVAGLPDICYIRFDPNINLKPFAYMFSDYDASLLNVLLFIPLGIFLPCLWQYFRKLLNGLLFGFCMSLLVEALQIFSYRSTDINDLMTNTLGTVLGWCVGQIILRCFPGIEPSTKTTDLWIICGTVFCVMFVAHPFLSKFLLSFT